MVCLTDAFCFRSIWLMTSMRRIRNIFLAALFGVLPLGTVSFAGEAPSTNSSAVSLTDAQRDFMKWRFGMFLHFNLGTFADLDWAGGYEDPALFKPSKLDCGQWADAAKEAGMTYLVLTVKHTEGIALYDSAVTTHDITMFKNYKNGKGDIVREFVDACRSRGLKIGLYYCFPGDYSDVAHKNAPPPGQPDLHGLPPEAIGDFVGFIKKQLTEMLTKYGSIDLLWIDQCDNKYTSQPSGPKFLPASGRFNHTASWWRTMHKICTSLMRWASSFRGNMNCRPLTTTRPRKFATRSRPAVGGSGARRKIRPIFKLQTSSWTG